MSDFNHFELSEIQIKLIDLVRCLEVDFLDKLKIVSPHSNQRWHEIAKTHFEQGFMAQLRALVKPDG